MTVCALSSASDHRLNSAARHARKSRTTQTASDSASAAFPPTVVPFPLAAGAPPRDEEGLRRTCTPPLNEEALRVREAAVTSASGVARASAVRRGNLNNLHDFAVSPHPFQVRRSDAQDLSCRRISLARVVVIVFLLRRRTPHRGRSDEGGTEQIQQERLDERVRAPFEEYADASDGEGRG
eukprot:CAMPEP_0113579958 /NCGR_PEP_ID=MMETSP0015_2-20120614/30378_1 /TAXON_ID=2838 /ORGANISM="Odontella" /LENGTH=180 /DNA_ID=CAMNT_0000484037 /DNA_START=23 /DNA_END=563 /DNA_ORIENTATION=- /assembly_acc=CAM_ASM_000160